VTGEEWLACADPASMIRFLELGRKTSCRQLRLFGVACCRRVGRFLDDERFQRIVEAAEAYADRTVNAGTLRAAHRRSCTLHKRAKVIPGNRVACILGHAAVAVNWVSASDAQFRTNDRMNRCVPWGYLARAAAYIADSAADAVFYGTYERADAFDIARRRRVERAPTPADAIWDAEEAVQADLLRCVVGNPFRPVRCDPSWVAWEGGTVPRLARAAYEHRRLPSGELDAARLGVLADALEEAGCTDAELLGHLRGPALHVRGCWAVDAVLLGKS
jgi:hypothetical protein